MFYNDVVKITRCNKLHLLSDLLKCISAKLLEASKFADLLPVSFRFSSVNFCQPDFSLIQRPVKSTLSTFPVGGSRSTRRKPTTFGRALTVSFHISAHKVRSVCSDDRSIDISFFFEFKLHSLTPLLLRPCLSEI